MELENRRHVAEGHIRKRAARLPGALMMGTFLVATLAACDAGRDNPTPTPLPTPAQRPPDFSIRYEWLAGSMPPPFHYEYTVTIGSDGAGKVEYSPDYPSDKVPTWTETFTVTQAQLDNLYSEAVNRKLFRLVWLEGEKLVGGSLEWAEIKSNGVEHKIPSSLQALDQTSVQDFYATVKGLVPQATWDKLEAQRQTFKEEFEKTHK